MHKGMAIVNDRASNIGRKESRSPEESVREMLSGREISRLFDVVLETEADVNERKDISTAYQKIMSLRQW